MRRSICVFVSKYRGRGTVRMCANRGAYNTPIKLHLKKPRDSLQCFTENSQIRNGARHHYK